MTDEVLFSHEGHLGVITLNRPKALNALTLPMILAMYEQLQAWRHQPDIGAVVIRAVPGTAFCAGGDVRWLYQQGKAHPEQALSFFWHEYRLNHLIHHLGKPYIALMDGITMGGGVGVSLHGSHPIATERFVFAMPETSIGFFPDIGASYLLNRCPQGMGMYLGLTGNRLNASEARSCGLVSAVIDSGDMDALFHALTALDLQEHAKHSIDACMASFAKAAPDHHQNPQCFSQQNLDAILYCISESDETLHHTLKQKSPLSLCITFEQLKRSQGLSLAQCLQIDFTLVQHFMQDHDFYEGVRALLVDKDKNPQWQYKEMQNISSSLVESYFATTDKTLRFEF